MDEIPMQVYCTVLYGVYCTVLYGVYIRVATELVPPDVISVSSHPAVLASQVLYIAQITVTGECQCSYNIKFNLQLCKIFK